MIEAKAKKLPKLRFRGFSGEWEEKRLDDIFDINAGGDIQKSHVIKIKDDKFKYPVFANSDIDKGLYGYSDIYKQEAGAVTVTGRGSLGVSIARREKFYPIVRLLVMRPKYRGDIVFYENLLNRINFFVESTGVPQLTGPQVSSYKAVIPKKVEEQEKIAGFLGVVDDKISGLEKKKKKLEKYKKGVMQKIFTQQIRFKDMKGRNYPGWQDQTFKSMIDIIIDNRGKTPPVQISGIPLIELNALGRKRINFSKISKFVSKKTYDNWFRKHIEPGDILFTTVGQTGLCSKYEGEVQASIAQNVVGLRAGKGYDKNFIYYLLSEPKNNHKFKRIEMIAVQPSLKVSQMIHLIFNVPNKEEQEAIADFLTALDDKIELTKRELEQAKRFKKSLLQQMFV